MKTTKERINYAARFIATGRESTRKFDSCLENNDNEVVFAALWQRAKTNPLGKLALGIKKYLITPESRNKISLT